MQNLEWLPQIDTDDEDIEAGPSNNDGDGDGDGLSPPSNNNGDNGGDIEVEQNVSEDDQDEQGQNDLYEEVPYDRRDKNLVIDFTTQ